MEDINNLTIIGRLTRDPELTQPKGTKLCKFSIANNDYVKNNEDGHVSYYNILVWNSQAEACTKYLNKGSQVLITGRLKQDRYEDKNGNKRSSISIIAHTVQFIGGKKDSQPTENKTEEQKFQNVDFNNPDNEEIPF